jgi:hypothetical protein
MKTVVHIVSKSKKVLLAPLILLLSSRELLAQGMPTDMGSQIPIAIWFAGTAVLGLVLAYGILHNRKRTRAEKQLTEKATKNLYAQEDREAN